MPDNSKHQGEGICEALHAGLAPQASSDPGKSVHLASRTLYVLSVTLIPSSYPKGSPFVFRLSL